MLGLYRYSLEHCGTCVHVPPLSVTSSGAHSGLQWSPRHFRACEHAQQPKLVPGSPGNGNNSTRGGPRPSYSPGALDGGGSGNFGIAEAPDFLQYFEEAG